MAIQVDYGPISTAMGLAQQAGAADRQQIGFGQDMQLMNYAQRAQQLANQQRSTEIQQSLSGQSLGLEAQRNQATEDLARQQLAAQTAYQQANLQSLSQYRQGSVGARQETADAASQRAQNQGDYNAGRLDIGQQNADTRGQSADQMAQNRAALAAIAQQRQGTYQQQVQQQGQIGEQRNDIAGSEADSRALLGEYNALQHGVDAAVRNFTDPNDPTIQAAKQRMAQIEATMKARPQSILGVQPQQAKTMVRQLPPQQQQQAQPGSSPAAAVPISSDQDYAKLPPGAYFTGPDGVLRQKP